MTDKKMLLVAGLAALMAAIASGFHLKAKAEGNSCQTRSRHLFNTFTAETATIKRKVDVSGMVAARQTAMVSAQVSGYVSDLRVSPGDRVKAGQVLLRIDTKELAEQEAQAKAALDGAKATLADAKKNFDRYTPLFESQAISGEQYENIRTKYKEAQAAEQVAEAALRESNQKLSYSKVRSPFDGIVGDRSINLGDLVTEGEALLSVYVPASLELVAPIGEHYGRYVEEGTQVSVSVPSIGFNQITHIRNVIPQINEQARTITVKAPLSGSPELSPGLYGELSFDTMVSEVIVIPSKAVIRTGQLESVRVLNQGRLKRLYVTTGRKLKGGKIEILSGLKPGDEIVTD
jgi:RND family efflux transporter MFP subunit